MIGLKTFLDHKDGTYVNLKMDMEGQKQLFAFVNKLLPSEALTNPTEYHSTIIYSRTPCPEAENYQFNMPVLAKVKEWKLFDTKTGGKCLVAVLKCREMEEMHRDLRIAYGASHDYPEYHPHVTVCYNFTGDKIPSEIPSFYLTFDRAEVKPLDVDYVPGQT